MNIDEAIEIIDDIISDYEYRCNCEDEEDEQQGIMLKIEALNLLKMMALTNKDILKEVLKEIIREEG